MSGVSFDCSKKQSTTLCPPPAGRLIGRHSDPKDSVICVISDSRSMSSASILLTMIMRQRFLLAAASIMRRVVISIPERASITMAAVSTAGRTLSARPRKSGYPGVSRRLRWVPS